MNSDKRLIRNTAGEVVEDDGKTGGQLIVGAGGVVSEADEADVKAFLGTKAESQTEPKTEGKAVSAPPENKAVSAPMDVKSAEFLKESPKGRR